jgi:alpha-tubulin suppressor-like RCC1 family protein
VGAFVAVAACVGDEPASAVGNDASSDSPASNEAGGGNDGSTADAVADSPSATDGGDASEGGCTIPPSSVVLNDATELALGNNHGCAIRANGSVVCWGDNAKGQLGVNPATTPSSLRPVTVAFPNPVQIIKLGLSDGSSFALDSNHQLWAWGDNSSGLLANGSIDTNAHPTPAQIDVGSNPNLVYDFAVAWSSVCAVTGSGYVKCWGDNGLQQLGPNPPDASSNTPVAAFSSAFSTTNVKVYSGRGATDICLISSVGDTWCWGALFANGLSKSGYNSGFGAQLREAGAALPMAQFDIGTNFGCALDANNGLFCWGYNSSDQLTPAGIAKSTSSIPPVKVSALQPARLATGYVHVCALDGAGHVQCWGDDAHAQLGRGTSGGTSGTPMAVVGMDGGGTLGSVVGVASGFFFSCAILTGECGPAGPGSVVCWGENGNEQLGRDAGATSSVPVQVLAP